MGNIHKMQGQTPLPSLYYAPYFENIIVLTMYPSKNYMDIVIVANLSTLCNIWVSLTLIKLFIKNLNFFHNCVNNIRSPNHHLSNIHKIMLPFIECSPNIVFWVYLQFACGVVMSTSKEKTHHYIYYCCIPKFVLLFLPLSFYEIKFFLCTMQVIKQAIIPCPI